MLLRRLFVLSMLFGGCLPVLLTGCGESKEVRQATGVDVEPPPLTPEEEEIERKNEKYLRGE